MSTDFRRRETGMLAWLGASALLASGAKPAAAAGEMGIAHDQATGLLEIDPKKFSRPTAIDNRWMALTPGKQLILEGHTIEDRKRVPHRVVYTVTDLVKVINGIPVVLVHDMDFSNGQLEEQELTFFAQDDDGAVWHLGQIRETYDEAEFVGGKAWMVGHLEGAKAGIMMPADPREGTPSYSEGFAPPPFNWTDRGRVRRVGERTTVPAGRFENVLLIEEWDAEAIGGSQFKYYAEGVGFVRVDWGGNDPTKEVLELVKLVRLGPDEMAEVRAAARKMEERAYVYAGTKPAEPGNREP
ncbi:MAG TPA: hypothetical protein VE684_16305 [Crenalkalicoccus sp.]|jgi:hypothetical protein|nr:hypothetical protein [Crenalkalicoccus sp.]